MASASAEVAAVGATLTDNDAMSVSESIPAPIQELWRQAVEHAEVAEDDLHLLAGTGDPMTDPRPSVHLKPGMELAYTEWREMFDQAGLDEANDPTYLHTHRIGLRCDCPWDTPLARAIALGLLRHEAPTPRTSMRSLTSLTPWRRPRMGRQATRTTGSCQPSVAPTPPRRRSSAPGPPQRSLGTCKLAILLRLLPPKQPSQLPPFLA